MRFAKSFNGSCPRAEGPVLRYEPMCVFISREPYDNLPMSVRMTADRVLEATEELRELRGRLAELDQERAAIETRIETLLGEIAGKALSPQEAAAAEPPKPVPVNTCDKILQTLNESPDQEFTATQLYRIWKEKRRSSLPGFYSALSRLTAQKKIRRVRFGRYSAWG